MKLMNIQKSYSISALVRITFENILDNKANLQILMSQNNSDRCLSMYVTSVGFGVV